MLNSLVENIKDKILEKNPYFTNGFTRVTRSTEKGLVLKGDVPVFPSDDLGNYFYMRLPNNVSFDNSDYNDIADSIAGVGLSAQVVLVACVNGADPDRLIENIINSLRVTCDENIVFNSYIFIPEEVVRTELQFMSADSSETNPCVISVSPTACW